MLLDQDASISRDEFGLNFGSDIRQFDSDFSLTQTGSGLEVIFFYAQLVFLLINVKMPTTVGILTFMSS